MLPNLGSMLAATDALMSYTQDRKLEIYSRAVDGLISLEQRDEFRLKYIEFIDQDANLSAL